MKIDRLIFNDCIITGIEADVSPYREGIIINEFDFDFSDIFGNSAWKSEMSEGEVLSFLAKKKYTAPKARLRISKEIEKYCNQFYNEYRAKFSEGTAIKYPAMLSFKLLQEAHITDIHLDSDF